MCNDNCHDCHDDCFDGPLLPMDNWPQSDSWCDQLAGIVEEFNRNKTPCNLKGGVVSSVKLGDGSFTVTLSVTGNTGPVELSLNRKNYTSGLSITGARGTAVVVYVREQFTPKCQTAVFVELEKPGCVPPAKPQLTIVNNTCDNINAGSIALSSYPTGLTAYWYSSGNGTGTASTTPPVYQKDRTVSGSVRFVITSNPTCQSELTTFSTSPANCGCTSVGFGGTVLPAANVGLFYTRRIPLTGTAPFSLGQLIKPNWMTVQIEERDLVLSGTPLSGNIAYGEQVQITVINCANQSSNLSTTIAVTSSCSQVEADFEVVGKHCRTCTPTPNYRIAGLGCYDPTLPSDPGCKSYSPTYKIADVRCVNATTNPCADLSESWKVSAVKCGSTTGTPTDPCAGVTASHKIASVRCTGSGDTGAIDPCAGKTANYKIVTIRCQN